MAWTDETSSTERIRCWFVVASVRCVSVPDTIECRSAFSTLFMSTAIEQLLCVTGCCASHQTNNRLVEINPWFSDWNSINDVRHWVQVILKMFENITGHWSAPVHVFWLCCLQILFDFPASGARFKQPIANQKMNQLKKKEWEKLTSRRIKTNNNGFITETNSVFLARSTSNDCFNSLLDKLQAARIFFVSKLVLFLRKSHRRMKSKCIDWRINLNLH